MSSQSLCARVTATEVSALASICWLHATPEKQHAVMIAIVSWIVVLELATPIFSTFAARKLCHAGCGLGIMCLDSQYLVSRFFVWAIAAGSILMTWNLSPLPPFRFSRERDVGITLYLLLVSTWFALQLPALLAGEGLFGSEAEVHADSAAPRAALALALGACFVTGVRLHGLLNARLASSAHTAPVDADPADLWR